MSLRRLPILASVALSIVASLAGLSSESAFAQECIERLAEHDTPGWAQSVWVSGGHAYVADSVDGLRIINISTPTLPFEVASIATTGPASAVTGSGDYAYVAASTGGLRVIDVSVPPAPVEVGFYTAGSGQARGVTLVGGLAYVAYHTSGLVVVDVSTPSSPQLVGSVVMATLPCASY